MTKLTIAPLSIPGSITTASQSAIEHAGRLFLQTANSPCARWITDAGLPYVSMDDLYDSSYDYDELNQAIAARLMCGCDAVYAVSGRGIGEGQLSAIREAASKAGATVKVLPGIGYSDAVLADLYLIRQARDMRRQRSSRYHRPLPAPLCRGDGYPALRGRCKAGAA